ncbi:MAG: class A beta-lactamase-related serine hydrolase [Muribaculaceae bacterium]|nr:class A beta-lactamase-related serine hydrolase [Muribaculaceae bacterium]
MSFIPLLVAGQPRQRLASDLHRIIGQDKIGVAVIFDDGDTLALDGHERFPMMSVAKFHQAVALGRKIGYPAIMSDTVRLSASDLPGGTWSPLRARFPEGVTLVIPELLYQSLAMSDNNACDYIFNHMASPSEVDSIIRSTTPARDFAVCDTEAGMHADPSLAERNYSTPIDAASLFHHFFTSDTTTAAVVVKAVMSAPCAFGADRLAAGIPQGKALLFHKTGTGFDLPGGGVSAFNDVGHVCYTRPDGRSGYYTIAVFIRDFQGSPAEGAARIAEISAAVWNATVLERVAGMNASAYIWPGNRNGNSRTVPANKKQEFIDSVTEAVFDVVLESIFE